MISRLLIVRGVRTTDELQQLGLVMAQRYESADTVALIGNDGRGLVVKGAEDTVVVELYDADPSAGRCMEQVDRVKRAIEEQLPDWKQREAIGLFLYFWPLSPGSVDVVADAMTRGDAKAVEKAADWFIESLGTLLGDASDAGGHAAADGTPGSVSGSGSRRAHSS